VVVQEADRRGIRPPLSGPLAVGIVGQRHYPPLSCRNATILVSIYAPEVRRPACNRRPSTCSLMARSAAKKEGLEAGEGGRQGKRNQGALFVSPCPIVTWRNL
jgi:hypothetical protein